MSLVVYLYLKMKFLGMGEQWAVEILMQVELGGERLPSLDKVLVKAADDRAREADADIGPAHARALGAVD